MTPRSQARPLKGWCKEASVQMLRMPAIGMVRIWLHNTSPEESPSRMTTAIHLRQLLPFSFCSLRPKKGHETEPQWGGKYKAYIYATVVYIG